MWAQYTATSTFSTPGAISVFKVPAGVLSLDVECWGAGGAGGGVNGVLKGGGGGGGGAYRMVTLSVTPTDLLNYKVGAGGAGIGGNNGGNGEITTFSTVNANGGSGGLSGGSGGAGGSASGPGTFWSGGNGANTAINLVLASVISGAGGAGAGGNAGGGSGGLSVVLLSDGNPGNAPGGGGSGGAALLTLGSQKGGNGGNGKINVTYTCPTYALTSSTTATDVCTTVGTTSTVTLTGGSSLPNGDYVVTYNRSNPSSGGTGLTATMSVTGGTGIGIFTAVGLNTVGTSTITVTNLASESCTNIISTFNTVTINIYSASVGGSINTPAAICSGGTSGLLTLSGHTGSVIKWQYAVNPFSTWTDILSATTDTYTSGVLTQTTQFRAMVKNGACSETPSIATTVTVNPVPTITTSGTLDNICFSTSSQMAVLPYSATTNTPISYSIVWNPAAISAGLTNQGTTAFSFLSGAGNLNTITIPGNLPPNTYFGTMSILNANCSVNQAIQLTLIPKPSASISGTIAPPKCDEPTGSVTLNALPASVTWTIKQTGTASATYTNTGTSYTVSSLIPGNYTFTVEYSGSCISSSTNVVIDNLVNNVYNNGDWSQGTPTVDQNLIFNSSFTTEGGGLGDIIGCTCLVKAGSNVIISNLDTLTIYNEVVNDGGTLTFENNASLVQVNADAINSGDIIYKRTSTPMKSFDFTYWSSPVAGQTLVGLSANTFWDKYFSFTGTAWREEQYGATVMAPGIGYIIRTPKEGTWSNGEVVTFPYSQEVEFIGPPNNGNISGQTVEAGNFYLIGNPYPCALSADTFLFANPNPNNSAILDGTIYFWTHNTPLQMVGSQYAYSSSDYATYNGVGGTATSPAPSGGAAPSGNIAAGQSFFALASADGTVTFNNGMRIHGDNNQFFKPAKTVKPSLLEKHRVWLNMTNKGGAFKQLLIGYIEGATNDYDSDFDGITFDGNAYIDFYSMNLGKKLVIQGRALPLNNSDNVPLGYRTITAGNFTISIDQTDGILSSQPVYLEDKLTNTINDLSQNDYTFTTGAGVFNNRFVLRYENKTLAADEFEADNNNVLVWIDNKGLRLISNTENINKVFIYDISGKLVYNNSEISSSEAIISNLKFKKGEVLLIKIALANNDIITKKVITGIK